MTIKHPAAVTYQKNIEMCSNIPENKKLTNQLENIIKVKHHLCLQNHVEIQDNTAKDTSMALVNNSENKNPNFSKGTPEKIYQS